MDRLSAAHNYAERGWHVLPMEPHGKRPLGRLAPHGHRNATINNNLIEEWWRADPEANVGLATGLAFDVIDVDGQDGYEALTAEMPKDGGHIWHATSITGRGGWHV
jgi:hypothetical protein